jgi:small subunit ribosomal protein S17
MSDTTQATTAAKAAPNGAAAHAHSFRRKMTGKVIRDKMNKTVTVEVRSARKDPLYGKYVRSRSRFKAHDEKNEFKVGDEVEIQEHAPISKDKRFIVIRLIKKFVEE